MRILVRAPDALRGIQPGGVGGRGGTRARARGCESVREREVVRESTRYAGTPPYTHARAHTLKCTHAHAHARSSFDACMRHQVVCAFHASHRWALFLMSLLCHWVCARRAERTGVCMCSCDCSAERHAPTGVLACARKLYLVQPRPYRTPVGLDCLLLCVCVCVCVCVWPGVESIRGWSH